MKKGESLSLNTIIIAVIALVVLIVIIAIYTGFIGKTTRDLGKPADQAGLQANDASWCLPEITKGGTCTDVSGDKCGGDCLAATPAKTDSGCILTCTNSGAQKHGLAKGSADRD